MERVGGLRPALLFEDGDKGLGSLLDLDASGVSRETGLSSGVALSEYLSMVSPRRPML